MRGLSSYQVRRRRGGGCWNPTLSSSWSTRRCRMSSATSCAPTPWRKTDAGVIFLAKAAAAKQLLTPLSEEGVLLVTKPFSNTFFLQAIHMAAASNHRLLPFAAGESADAGKAGAGAAGEPRQVLPHRAGPYDRGRGAPLHRAKKAMDTRRDRAEVAQEILDSYDPAQ